MEFLEGVVREHGAVDLLGNSEQEGVAAADGARRRVDVLARQGRLLETLQLTRIDPMRERGVDNGRDLGAGMLPL
jgi:hypothetical protein